MDTITMQFRAEYQTRSLLEYLLGDGEHPGWLDEQSRTQNQARTGVTKTNAFSQMAPSQ